MKTKFLLVLAATSAFFSALSSVIVAPANAQVTTSANNVAVTLTVPEVLYLRTVSTIDLLLIPADLSAKTFTAQGSGFYSTDKSGTANPTTSGLDPTSPFNNNGTNLSVTKTIPKVFAVWSNSPRNNPVTVSVQPGNSITLTGANSAQAKLTNGVANPSSAAVPGLVTPFIGGVDLSVDVLGIAQAGAYSGADINISATAN